MARNIELKARCSDLDAAAAVCRRLGAPLQWTRRQTDTYFRVAHGRLKLRQEEPGVAVLVEYHRANASAARECRYTLTPAPHAEETLDALSARHGVLVQVVKTRSLYLLAHVRIHLDRVDGLGTFIEFEAVMGPQHDDAATHARLAELCAAFGIADEDLVPVSYSNLLMGDA